MAREALRAWGGFRRAGRDTGSCVAWMTPAAALLPTDPDRAFDHARRAMESAPPDLPAPVGWQVRARGAAIARASGRGATADLWAGEGRRLLEPLLGAYGAGVRGVGEWTERVHRQRALASIADLFPAEDGGAG